MNSDREIEDREITDRENKHSDRENTDRKTADCCSACGQNIVRCGVCNVTFKRKSNLEAHNKSMHHIMNVQKMSKKFRYRELEELSNQYPESYSSFAIIGMIEVYLKSHMITDKRRKMYDDVFDQLKKADHKKMYTFNDIDCMMGY